MPDVLARAAARVHAARARRRARPLRILGPNLQKDWSGDRQHWRHLRRFALRGAARHGLALACEVGHGLDSTRIRGFRKRIHGRRRTEVGRRGVHRAVEQGWTWCGATRLHLIALHALHVPTMGRAAQDDYFTALAHVTRGHNAAGREWVAGPDFNRDPEQVARMLGGVVLVEEGGMALIGSPSLADRVVRRGIDRTGKRRRYTDHVTPWIDLRPDTKEHR